LESGLAESKKQITYLENSLSEMAKNISQLEMMYDRIQVQLDRNSVAFGTTERSFYLDGWVRVDQVDD
jgi:hypothetical protein